MQSRFESGGKKAVPVTPWIIGQLQFLVALRRRPWWNRQPLRAPTHGRRAALRLEATLIGQIIDTSNLQNNSNSNRSVDEMDHTT
jgi:hypothetical protein